MNKSESISNLAKALCKAQNEMGGAVKVAQIECAAVIEVHAGDPRVVVEVVVAPAIDPNRAGIRAASVVQRAGQSDAGH